MKRVGCAGILSGSLVGGPHRLAAPVKAGAIVFNIAACGVAGIVRRLCIGFVCLPYTTGVRVVSRFGFSAGGLLSGNLCASVFW